MYYETKQDIKIMRLIIILLLLIIIYIFIIIFKKYTKENKKENFKTERKNEKKYNMAIMTIFKNEQDYMEEWLDHHISQGFDKFYLYCNDPLITNYIFLKKSKYVNLIDLINWVDKKNIGSQTIQRQAYTHCVQAYSKSCQFLLMLDLDEFLVPTDLYPTVSDYIQSLKLIWHEIKAFKIQRYDFGSNGHKTKPVGSIVSNYKFHEKICSSYKTMANTDFIDKTKSFYGVHDFNFIDKCAHIYNNYLNYNTTGFPSSCNSKSINEIPLVINHYYIKSYEEYMKRCELWKDGGINPIGYRTDCENNFYLRDITN